MAENQPSNANQPYANSRVKLRTRWWQFWRPVKPVYPEARANDGDEEQSYSALIALVTAGVLVVLVLAFLVALLIRLAEPNEDGKQPASNPEAALSLVFVATVVVLILVMCTLSIVFRRLGVYDESEAMGLPRGSVRAVIALLLIMLFFISAIFLFNSTKNGSTKEDRTLEHVTEAAYGQIPAEEIQSAVRGDDGTYTVIRTGNTSTSNDIAKQLITTVATLVTAVAAFYFGANSVTNAAKDARQGNPRTRTGQGGQGTPTGSGGGGELTDGAAESDGSTSGAVRSTGAAQGQARGHDGPD